MYLVALGFKERYVKFKFIIAEMIDKCTSYVNKSLKPLAAITKVLS